MSLFIEILFLLMAAHALADYPLQGDFLANAKNRTAPIDDRHIRALEVKWRNIANGVKFKDETASTAYFRLMHITRRDREACGDGRWVRSFFLDWFVVMAVANAAAAGVHGCARLLKPHYRWEPRR